MQQNGQAVLLTGGLGYIGSHTAVVLSDAGYTPVLLDNLSNSSRDVHHAIEMITGRSLPFVESDVRDTQRVSTTLMEHQISAVIHFAGLKAVGESVTHPIAYFDNNVCGTISLLHAMRNAGVGTLVFSSSATVYGDPDVCPIDESHPTRVTNPYGRTKLHVEQMLNDIAAIPDPALPWRVVCLRYFNPVGAHPGGLIGEAPHGLPNNLMPYVAQVAAGRLDRLNVFGNDYSTRDGTGVRDYIHVMDLAYGHEAALRFLSTNTGWHAFNLGTGTGYSVLEMVKAFEQASGRCVPYKITSRRPGDVASCYADPQKAKRLLGWEAKLNLADMCETTWRFQQRHGQPLS